MATRYAVGNGNWSSAATWDNGATLGIPTAGDDVYANGFTINVDQSFNVATLRNTALAAQDSRLNPIMTNNTTPSGVASASSNATDAWRVFDGVVSVVSGRWTASSGVPQWVQYQFTSPLIIRSYSIYYEAINGRAVNFNLQGSNDGVSFTTLDTRTGFTVTTGQYNTMTITNPTTAYSYYRINVTATHDGNVPTISELTFNEAGASVVAGGSFNFNTSGVTGTVTNATQAFFIGAANIVTVTATSGTITLNSTPNITTGFLFFTHSGNCNFNFSSGTITNTSNLVGTQTITKTSSGLLTLSANLNGPTLANSGSTLSFSAGSVIVIGNLVGGAGTSNSVITSSSSAQSLTVTGTVTGGSTGVGITTVCPVNNITGNVTAGTVAAISSTSANTINITGTVTASATAPAISMTNANGQVYLNGNMVNNNGKMAIFAPIVWLDKNNTTSAAFFTSGGGNRTLYSEDTVPNTPAANNVREGVVFGAGNSLTGTIQMPVAADVRNGVVYDNGTTGTALFTTSQLLTEINASSDAVAVRMQNLCTPMILGELMEAFKK